MTRLALVPIRSDAERDLYDWDGEGKAVLKDFSRDELFAQEVESIWTTLPVDGLSGENAIEEASAKTLGQGKEEMLVSLGKARNELLLANDLLSLLRSSSKQEVNGKAQQASDLPLAAGTFGLTSVSKPGLPFLTHPHIALRQCREKISMKDEACEASLRTLRNLRTALHDAFVLEKRLWACAVGLRDRGWGLSCAHELLAGIDAPRKVKRLVVRFGLDAMSEPMKRRCVASLERDEETRRPKLGWTRTRRRLRCRLLQFGPNGTLQCLHPREPAIVEASPKDEEDAVRLHKELEEARAEMIDLDLFGRTRTDAHSQGLLQTNAKSDTLDLKIGAGCFLRITHKTADEQEDRASLLENADSSSMLAGFDLGHVIYHLLRLLYVRGLQSGRACAMVDDHGDVTSKPVQHSFVTPIISPLTGWVVSWAARKALKEVQDWAGVLGFELRSEGGVVDRIPDEWKDLLRDPTMGLTKAVSAPQSKTIEQVFTKDDRCIDSWMVMLGGSPLVQLVHGESIVPCASDDDLKALSQRICLNAGLDDLQRVLESERGDRWRFKRVQQTLMAASREGQDGVKMEWKGGPAFGVKVWKRGVEGEEERDEGDVWHLFRQTLQRLEQDV